jgi:hypothetical protein
LSQKTKSLSLQYKPLMTRALAPPVRNKSTTRGGQLDNSKEEEGENRKTSDFEDGKRKSS